MPSRKDPWIADMHSWDERIGLDASITHVGGGKKQFADSTSKFKSSIPIPLHDQPFLVPMPASGEFESQKPVTVNTDIHMWRSYRTIVSGDGTAAEGKKMGAHPMPMIEVQRHVRKCLRDKLREQERKELAMRHEHLLQREQLKVRHQNLAALEESFLRNRAKSLGFEGLRKPVTRPPPSLPSVDKAAVERVFTECSAVPGATFLKEPGGKRTCRDHPSLRNNGPPFGALSPVPGTAHSATPEPSMQRWTDKCLC